jgi:TusA-related sulfurtransferase
VGTKDTQLTCLDLTSFKCPRALIELKIGLIDIEVGHRFTLLLNTKYNNQDIFMFLETSNVVVEVVEKAAATQTLTLIKS